MCPWKLLKSDQITIAGHKWATIVNYSKSLNCIENNEEEKKNTNVLWLRKNSLLKAENHECKIVHKKRICTSE